MITRAKFQNFKALRDVEITFDSRLTVLVGPNGSGKTSVLEGILFLGKYALNSKPPMQFKVPISTPMGGGSLGVFGWQHDPSALFDGQVFPGSTLEVATVLADNEEISCKYVGSIAGTPGTKEQFCFSTESHTSNQRSIFPHIRSMMLLQLHSHELRNPSFPHQIPPSINPNGSGLATALAYMQKKYPEQFQAVIEALREVIPNFVRVRLDLKQCSALIRTPSGDSYEQTQFADVFILDFKNASGVNPASVSDGTLFVLGLVTIILGPVQPKLILLDDLDHRLHPKAQMQLIGLLRKLLDQFPDLQIIATAHSPYILDRLEWDEVRIMALNDDGSAVCKPITDHPDFERWKEAMSPGEFWSTFYEDWLTKAREPQPVP